ncbi:MAG: helix-turn-helix domain-containing protein [Owenweeksia sp.]
MTEKQEKILEAALKLFAEKGYTAVSTNKVARAAGVSEGLIFRHFANKEGLLEAIKQQGMERAQSLLGSMVMREDPKDILRGILDFPFNIDKEEYHYWRLMYALKWQADEYDHSMSHPMRKIAADAFKNLGYSDPGAEAELILILIDGLATAELLRKPENMKAVRQSLFKKYDL